MKLVLDILSGDSKGQKFLLQDGLKIGRKEADILLNDRKVSANHARIEVDAQGQFHLIDLGSSNGTLLNGRRTPKVPLQAGVQFQVGTTQMAIIELHEDELEALGLVSRSWKEILRDQLLNSDPPSMSVQVECRAFAQAIRLTFIEGPLTDEFITVGFGPRSAGFGNIDIDLKDPQISMTAFELIPTEDKAQIKNLDPMNITLNKEAFNTETLKDGDTIQIASSTLKVTFL